MVFMDMTAKQWEKARARKSASGFLAGVGVSGGVSGRGGVLGFFFKMRCLLVVLVLVSLLAACGGGDGSAPEEVSDASLVPASSSVPGTAGSGVGTTGTAAPSATTPSTAGSGATTSSTALPSTAVPDSTETEDDSDSSSLSGDASGAGSSSEATSSEGGTSEDAASSSTTSPSTTSPSSDSASVIQEASDELEALYADELDDLIETTERIRGLEFLRRPKFLLLDWEDFDESRSGEQTEETLEIYGVWETVYKLLGLLDPDDSLSRYLTGDGIAGFYDLNAERVIVPLSRTGMTVWDRYVLVHELVHALTDQYFNLGDSLVQLFQNDDIDKYGALNALIEGDAVESTRRYAEEELTAEEKEIFQNMQNAVASGNSTSDNSERVAAPQFLANFSAFPYDDGSRFLRSIAGYDESDDDAFDDEDFQKINELYANPPTSSEQIYYPERYPSDAPLEVDHRVTKLTGYELIITRDWGMLGFVSVFDQILGSEGASRSAVAGWGGDRFSLWSKDDEVALALTYRGDEASDTIEMAAAMRGYIALVTGDTAFLTFDEYPLFGVGENFLWLSVDGDTLRLVVASEQEAGEELAAFYSRNIVPVSSVSCQFTDSLLTLVSNLTFTAGASSTSANNGDPASASNADPTPDSNSDPASSSVSQPSSSPASSASTSDDSAIASSVATSSAAAPDDLTAFYEDELDEIIAATERIRGLKFLCEPQVVFLDRASLLARYIGEPSEEFYTGVDASVALQVLLGLVKPDVSPRQLLADRVRAFVGAFYDPEAKEVVVPISAAGIGRGTRLSLVHELVHALTDQHFNFRDTRNDLYNNNGDQFLAFSAVIEGDANETTDLFYREEQALVNRAARPPPQSSIMGASTAGASTPRSAIPQFLRDVSMFPYTYGSTFWGSLVGNDEAGSDETGLSESDLDEAGLDETNPDTPSNKDWQLVNNAYTNFPASTEQVYFPERYLSDAPLEVDHPVAELSGYELRDTDTWGAISFTVMFDQMLGREGPSRPAVKGWGGDRYSYWFNGSDVAMALTYRGDEASDAQELAEALSEYIATAMNAGDGGEDFAWLSVEGDTLRFIAASDPAAGAELVAFYEAI